MLAKCPACGTNLQPGQRFCPACGFQLVPPESTLGAPGQIPVAPPSSSAQAYPYPAMAGRSVIKAMMPASQPTRVFWVGLFMLLAGLFLVACPSALGLALAVGQSDEGQNQFVVDAVSVSACSTLFLLLPGVGMLVAGRPRR